MTSFSDGLQKDARGLWWPKYDGVDKLYAHFIKRVTDVDVAIEACRSHGVCLQAGGHTGLWARRLARTFEEVHSFEPVPELFTCLQLNTAHRPEVLPQQKALGASIGKVSITALPSGRSNIAGLTKPGDAPVVHECEMVTIDSLGLIRCDALFLDVERHELEVLRGASETVAKHSPVVTLEILGGQDVEYEAYMRKLGYQKIRKVHNDVIFTRNK